MPLLTEADPPKKRRSPVWALFLLAWVLLPVVAFAWSFVQPVRIGTQHRRITFGISNFDYSTMDQIVSPTFGLLHIKLPGGPATGEYVFSWAW
jgi:hypothetical protein